MSDSGLTAAGSSTYSSNTLHVGDGTWDTQRDTFLLPNLMGLNFETMRYNGQSTWTYADNWVLLTHFRHGQSVQGYGRIPFHYYRARCYCNDCFLGPRPYFDLNHPILLPMEPILGIQAPCLVSDTHAALVNGSVCAGLVCGRTKAKPDQPTPWNWPSNLCDGHLPGSVGLVLAQKRE